jgi:hypothetical protein
MLVALFGWHGLTVAHAQGSDQAGGAGAVYTSTNDPAGNRVLAFSRAGDGSLTSAGSFPTGGVGTGSGLGSQGALVLSESHRVLYVVNAGSNDISAFAVRHDGLALIGRVPSGGVRPISLTVSGPCSMSSMPATPATSRASRVRATARSYR